MPQGSLFPELSYANTVQQYQGAPNDRFASMAEGLSSRYVDTRAERDRIELLAASYDVLPDNAHFKKAALDKIRQGTQAIVDRGGDFENADLETTQLAKELLMDEGLKGAVNTKASYSANLKELKDNPAVSDERARKLAAMSIDDIKGDHVDPLTGMYVSGFKTYTPPNKVYEIDTHVDELIKGYAASSLGISAGDIQSVTSADGNKYEVITKSGNREFVDRNIVDADTQSALRRSEEGKAWRAFTNVADTYGVDFSTQNVTNMLQTADEKKAFEEETAELQKLRPDLSEQDINKLLYTEFLNESEIQGAASRGANKVAFTKDTFSHEIKDNKIAEAKQAEIDAEKKKWGLADTSTNFNVLETNNRPHNVSELTKNKRDSQLDVANKIEAIVDRVKEFNSGNNDKYKVKVSRTAEGKLVSVAIIDANGNAIEPTTTDADGTITHNPKYPITVSTLFQELDQKRRTAEDIEEYEKEAKAKAGITEAESIEFSTEYLKNNVENFDLKVNNVLAGAIKVGDKEYFSANLPTEDYNVNSVENAELKEKGISLPHFDNEARKEIITREFGTLAQRQSRFTDLAITSRPDVFMENSAKYKEYEKVLKEQSADNTTVAGFRKYKEAASNEEALEHIFAAIDGNKLGGAVRAINATQTDGNKVYEMIGLGGEKKNVMPKFMGSGIVEGQLKYAYRFFDGVNEIGEPIFLDAPGNALEMQVHNNEDMQMDDTFLGQIQNVFDSKVGTGSFGIKDYEWEIDLSNVNSKGKIDDQRFEVRIPLENGKMTEPIPFKSYADLKKSYIDTYNKQVSQSDAAKTVGRNQIDEMFKDYTAAEQDSIATLIKFETAGTNRTDIYPKNKDGSRASSAMGLLQFTTDGISQLKQDFPNKYQDLTRAKLEKMTAQEQLPIVRDYLHKYKNKVSRPEELYLAVIAPAMIGKPLNTTLDKIPEWTQTMHDANPAFSKDKNGNSIPRSQVTILDILQTVYGTVK